jgi:hypothetical protein
MADIARSQEEAANKLLSTYQWVTVKQLFDRVGLVLQQADIEIILSTRTSFYYRMLLPAMMHVLNGIILDQTKEYRLFLQKSLIDFLMSGGADHPAGTKGAETGALVEKERTAAIRTSEGLDRIQSAHHAMIAKTQSATKAFIASWTQYVHTIYGDMKNALAGCQINAEFSEADLHGLFVDAHLFTIQGSAWERFIKKLNVPMSAAGVDIIKAQWGEFSCVRAA